MSRPSEASTPMLTTEIRARSNAYSTSTCPFLSRASLETTPGDFSSCKCLPSDPRGPGRSPSGDLRASSGLSWSALRRRRVRDSRLDTLGDALDVQTEGLQHEDRDDRDECEDQRLLAHRLPCRPTEPVASCEPKAVCLVLKHGAPSLVDYLEPDDRECLGCRVGDASRPVMQRLPLAPPFVFAAVAENAVQERVLLVSAQDVTNRS